MKKIMTFLLTLIIAMIPFSIKAEDEHVIVDDINDYFSSASEFRQLESELQQIEADYSTGIYIILDRSITNVTSYAKDFLSSLNGDSVVLAVSEDGYSLQASGSHAGPVLSAETSLWNSYNDARTYSDGIRAFYRSVVQIIAKDNVVEGTTEYRYIVDDAYLLSGDERGRLEEKLSALSAKYGIDFVVHTTDSTGGVSQEAYADDYYDYNGYRDDGVLLLVDMGDRYIYISTKGEGIDLLTDYGLNLILDEVEEGMIDGDYYQAFSNFADKTEELIISGRKGDIVDVDPDAGEKEQKRFGLGNVGISALISAIASLITTGSMKGKMKTVSRQRYARNYVVNDSFVLTGASDMLVDKHVSRSRIVHDDDHRSHGGGGGSTIHVSSSGSTHGGQGRHF